MDLDELVAALGRYRAARPHLARALCCHQVGTAYIGGDAPVQATNDSSITSKASAASKGYFSDPFVAHVVASGPGGRPPQRAPLIHRGYYSRWVGITRAQDAFLELLSPDAAYNIVVLGAGFDTGALRRYWPGHLACYAEVDFPAVLERKRALLARAGVEKPGWLHACGADLRDLRAVETALMEAGVQFKLPTFLVAEVVFAYMGAAETEALLSWISRAFPSAMLTVYEQIGPDDAFGRFMIRHFDRRQCPLLALSQVPTLDAQKRRFGEYFQRVDAVDVMAVVCSESEAEMRRVQALEPFDEYEEYHLKCSHYFVLAARSGALAHDQLRLVEDPGPPQQQPRRRRAQARRLSASLAPWPRRYGLSAAVGTCGTLLFCGGTGTSCGSDSRGRGAPGEAAEAAELHKRHDDVCLLDLRAAIDGGDKEHPKELPAAVLGRHAASMYSTTTACCRGRRLFVFGGRLGPAKPSAALALWDEGSKALQPVPVGAPWPCARWRHTATCVPRPACDVSAAGSLPEELLVVLGGRGGQEGHVLGLEEVWALDTKAMTWHQVVVAAAHGAALPTPRHSHGAASVSSGAVLVVGGLDQQERPLADAWRLELAWSCADGGLVLSGTWIEMEALRLPGRGRYGHDLHVFEDGAVLAVGGVDGVLGTPPLHLVCGAGGSPGAFFDIEEPGDDAEAAMSDELFMCHNAASVVLDERLVIVGGGGNCFSFGTHLNRHALSIDLHDLGISVSDK